MEYITWPVAIIVTATIGVLILRAPLANFINNLKAVNAPGVKLETTRQQEGLIVPEQQEASITAAQATIQSLTDIIQTFATQAADANLRAQISEVEKMQLIKEATDDILALRRESYHWWCKYLGAFLVPATKLTLLFIDAKEEGMSEENLDVAMRKYVSEEEQRLTIKNVLVETGVIINADGIYRTTPIGKVFIKFEMSNGTDLDLTPLDRQLYGHTAGD